MSNCSKNFQLIQHLLNMPELSLVSLYNGLLLSAVAQSVSVSYCYKLMDKNELVFDHIFINLLILSR